MTDARRAELVAMAKAAQAETYDGTLVSLPSYELLGLFRDLAAAEARLAERDELRHAALAKADEAMNAKCAERKRCEQAEARVGMLHHLVAAARTYIDPEQYAAWDAAAYAEVEPCDTLADQLAHAERERDVLRAERDMAQETGRRLANERDAARAERDALEEHRIRDLIFVRWWCEEHGSSPLPTMRRCPDCETAENAHLRARVAAAEEQIRGAVERSAAAHQAYEESETEGDHLRRRIEVAERLAAAVRDYENHHPPKGGWLPVYIATALAAFDATGREGGE